MKRRNLFSILLAASLLLGGCTAKQPGQTPAPAEPSGPMGRYVETDITPPGADKAGWVRSVGLHVGEDGVIDYFVQRDGDGPMVHYRSADRGATWKEEETGWLSKVSALCGRDVGRSVTDLDMDDDGNIYLTLFSDDFNLRLYQVTPENDVEEVVIPDLQGKGMELDVRGLRLTPGGNIGLLTFMGGEQTTLYNRTTGKVIARADEFSREWAAFTDSQVATVQDGRLVIQGPSDRREAALPHMGEELALEADRNGSILAVTHGGVDCLSSGAGVFETLFDGSPYSFGNPNRGIVAVRCQTDGTLYMVLDDGSTERLYRYAFDPDVPMKPDSQLNVFSLRDSVSVRASVIDFQMENPSVAVRYQVADDSPLEKDGVKALEGALQAGEGPDVILLDGLDWETYARNGWLAPLEAPDGCLPNVAESGETDGAVYAMPTRFVLWLTVDNGVAEPYEQVVTGLEGLHYTLAAMGNERDPAKMKGFYEPSAVVGITAGQNRELAQKFLETMLSERVQAEETGEGFPVREASLRDWLAKDEQQRFADIRDGFAELCKGLGKLIE